jgi:hypothetical protein
VLFIVEINVTVNRINGLSAAKNVFIVKEKIKGKMFDNFVRI